MPEGSPSIVILAGPNGAGKTTASRTLLVEELRVVTYVNADMIAQGLSGYAPERAATKAARIMLEHMHNLAARSESFAFESTLAGRGYIPWLRGLRQAGYEIFLHYFWLNSADLAIARVKERVRQGGHDVPEPTIRQRYSRSMRNLFALYLPLATNWIIYNNTSPGLPVIVATGDQSGVVTVHDPHLWTIIREGNVA